MKRFGPYYLHSFIRRNFQVIKTEQESNKLIFKKESKMSDYKLDGDYLKDRRGIKIGRIDGKYIRDGKSIKVGVIDGKYIRDSHGSKIADFDGTYIRDKNNFGE